MYTEIKVPARSSPPNTHTQTKTNTNTPGVCFLKRGNVIYHPSVYHNKQSLHHA